MVMACAGDVPTLGHPRPSSLLRSADQDIRIRRLVVDLVVLRPRSEGCGLEDEDFDALFCWTRPVIFAFRLPPST